MSKSRPLSEAERADLVAYLDGELAGEAKRAIETRITLDPLWRAEADALKRTWDLLDFLPQPEPSPSFTQRTLSKLDPIRSAPRRKKRVRVSTGWRLPHWLGLAGGWAAAVLLAVVVGYQVFEHGTPRVAGETELLRDLRIIENKRYYDLVDDIGFVKQLDHPDLFGEEGTGG
jgi:anti-sigma factor RsiW